MTTINTGFSNPYIGRSQADFESRVDNISSGKRIQSAADDAAGLAIATGFSSDIAGFDQAIRNSNDAISLSQVADGGLNSVSENLQRIRELALQSSNGTLNDKDRQALNAEASQLRDEISRVVDSANFNGVPLLSQDGEISIQAGANAGETISVRTRDLRQAIEDSGLAELDISSVEGAQAALGSVDDFQQASLSQAAEFGAVSNRFSSVIDNLGQQKIDASASRSRIEDADLAEQAALLARDKLQNQVSIAVQAQANQQAGNVLKLLS